jgi:hypothetical protein
MPPTAEEQVGFLLNIQQLLRDGVFTATYKYALLMALADLSVELGHRSGEELELSAYNIAEKFVEYYWRQTLPFLGRGVLSQNKGPTPVVVKLLLSLREKHGDNLAGAKKDRAGWRRLINDVAENIRTMPLRYLQNVGDRPLAFLYDPPSGKAPAKIRLYPGVSFCLRQFRGLVYEMVQAAWTRWVHKQNLSLIGEGADLHEFLFGVERSSLALVQKPLRELQVGACFYCHREMRDQSEVDHFVPWTRYPSHLGHNFVLAHRECNSAKRDLLASEDHLAAWAQRNRAHGEMLVREFDGLGVLHDLQATESIAYWAYNSESVGGGLTWKARKTLVPLTGEWSHLLGHREH